MDISKVCKNNFDEDNLGYVRSTLEQEKVSGPVIKRAFTLVQNNSSCDVNVTEESRRVCANALLK